MHTRHYSQQNRERLTCAGEFKPTSPTPKPPITSLSSLTQSVHVGNPAMELRLFLSMVIKNVSEINVSLFQNRLTWQENLINWISQLHGIFCVCVCVLGLSSGRKIHHTVVLSSKALRERPAGPTVLPSYLGPHCFQLKESTRVGFHMDDKLLRT